MAKKPKAAEAAGVGESVKPDIVETAVEQIHKVMAGVTDELRCQVMAQIRRTYGG